VQTTLPAAVRLILGDATDVVWKDRAEGQAFRAAVTVRLNIVSRIRLGVDEQRHAQEGADDLRETIVGNRRIAVQFQVETRDQDLLDSPGELADILAAGLERTDVHDLLAAAGLGSPMVQGAREVPYKDHAGRWRPVAVFEAWFPSARTHEAGLVPRVKAVEFSGDVDGTTVGPTTVTED
jgi:hypothetical protein